MISIVKQGIQQILKHPTLNGIVRRCESTRACCCLQLKKRTLRERMATLYRYRQQVYRASLLQ